MFLGSFSSELFFEEQSLIFMAHPPYLKPKNHLVFPRWLGWGFWQILLATIKAATEEADSDW
jgi:hypothetical protein